MKIAYFFSKIIKKLHIPAIKNSCLDKTARVCSSTLLVNTTLGRYSYVGDFCTIINTKVGNFCSIAGNCIIGGASHPIEWVSTSPVFHEGRNLMRKNYSSHEYCTTKETTIGNDVWIGNNCLIKGGITIADGSVIGMGSVVTKNVGAYEIWAGNPARLIRKRFDDDSIEKLMLSEWWNYDDQLLTQKALLFNDVKKFISQL